MRVLSLGLQKLVVGGLLASGVVASGLIVTGSSYSVFSATTTNPSDAWTAGNVSLTNDSSGAMFTVTGMKPGSTGTRCIAVTSNGSLPATIKLYGASYSNPTTTSSQALASGLNLVITQGTGGGFSAGCSGFTPLTSNSAVYSGTLASFGSAASSFATGYPTTGAWTTTGTAGESRVFQIQYTLDPNVSNAAQNGSASITFTWESQNT